MNRRLGAVSAVILLAALAGLLWSVRARAEEGPLDTRLTAAEGEVDVKLKGDTDWTPAEADTPLDVGDEVKTGASSRAEVSFGGQSVYELQENSDFSLAEASPNKQAFDLSLGTLLLHVKKMLVGQSVEVRTKAALAAVIGTELGVSATSDGITGVGVYEGEVLVEGKGVPGVPGKQFKVGKNKELRMKFGIHPEDPGPLKEFAGFRDRLKAMSARRIQLRRDWQAMAPEDRAAKRKQLMETRLKRRQDRAARLGKMEGPGGDQPGVKEPKVKKGAKGAKGARKGRKGRGKKKVAANE